MNHTDAPQQAEMRNAEATWDLLNEIGRSNILKEQGADDVDAILHSSVEWPALKESIKKLILEWMHNHPVGYFNTNKPEPLHINL